MKTILSFIALCCLPFLAFADTHMWQPSDGEELHFTLYNKKDKPVGSVRYIFSRSAEGLNVQRIEHMDVKKFLIRAVVDQDVKTLWREGEVQQFSSQTKADTSVMDKSLSLRLQRDDSGKLLGELNEDPIEVADNAWPMTYWHQDFVSRDLLFGTGGGEKIEQNITAQSADTVFADGRDLACDKYEIEAKIDGKKTTSTLWYEANGKLCGMLMKTGLGPIRYTRILRKEPKP